MTPTSENKPYFSTLKILGLPEDSKPNPLLLKAVEKIVGLEKINAIMEEVGRPWPNAYDLIDILFERLDIKWEVENPEVLQRLDDRPKVFVANHPYGMPDAFALFQLLMQHRPNIRLFANKILAASQLEEERLLYVDPFSSEESRGQNRKSVARALRHLRDGGDLALFPGRICSHLKTSDWTISDSEWTNQIHRFVEAGDADLVPLFISGRNSLMFNISGLIHPRIRTYMLMREFLKGGHDFRFRVGEPVPADRLARIARTMPTGTFSRSLTYALKTGAPEVPRIPHLVEPAYRTELETNRVNHVPVPISGGSVKAMLEREEPLVSKNEFTVYGTGSGVPDELLDVICEVRFAAYLSETDISSPSDLRDRFDDYYKHLILWDQKAETVAGVYRYTCPDPSVGPVDPENLVTNSIFNLKPQFKRLLPVAMEAGRAAILPEYQKSYAPLFMLWRAGLEIPMRDKNIRYLFGPVTIGKKFNPVSRELLRKFIMKYCADETMRGFAIPKREIDFEIPREVDLEELIGACGSFSQLATLINGFEGDRRELPVLFRHYFNMGCKYIDFGIWKELDNAMAGLTILDLKNISRTHLNRYFGPQKAEAFLAGR